MRHSGAALRIWSQLQCKNHCSGPLGLVRMHAVNQTPSIGFVWSYAPHAGATIA